MRLLRHHLMRYSRQSLLSQVKSRIYYNIHSLKAATSRKALNNSLLGMPSSLTLLIYASGVPLKIQDEFLGMIGLGTFFGREALEAWEKELLTTLANQISIAIAYSQMVEGVQSEKFRLFMLAESAPQNLPTPTT